MRNLSEGQLTVLAQAQNPAAFGELVRRHASRLRLILRRMGATSALADDVAQDALLIAFERIGTFRNEGPFGAWVARIASRLLIKRWRSERLDAWTSLDESPVEHGDTGSAPPVLLDLDTALSRLSAVERLCVTLCHGAGYTNAEIASELKLPLGTVKSHIKRGLDKLRATLSPDQSMESSP